MRFVLYETKLGDCFFPELLVYHCKSLRINVGSDYRGSTVFLILLCLLFPQLLSLLPPLLRQFLKRSSAHTEQPLLIATSSYLFSYIPSPCLASLPPSFLCISTISPVRLTLLRRRCRQHITSLTAETLICTLLSNDVLTLQRSLRLAYRHRVEYDTLISCALHFLSCVHKFTCPSANFSMINCHVYKSLQFSPTSSAEVKNGGAILPLQGMNSLRSLGSWDRGFESHTRHGCWVCLCVYSVFVLSCV
jgi:hypothetical protein